MTFEASRSPIGLSDSGTVSTLDPHKNAEYRRFIPPVGVGGSAIHVRWRR